MTKVLARLAHYRFAVMKTPAGRNSRLSCRAFRRHPCCEGFWCRAMRRLRYMCWRRSHVAASSVLVLLLVSVLCILLVDTDDVRILLLPPAKFSDWYEPIIKLRQAGGSMEPLPLSPSPPLLQPPRCVNSIQLAIYVHSAAPNLHRRALIRATWGNRDVLERYSARLVFVLGRSGDQTVMAAVRRESWRHHDVLLLELEDSYANLTHKALSALHWLSASCSHVRFVLKTDDDVVVAMEGLVEELGARYGWGQAPEKVLLCSKVSNPPVNRRWWSKWQTSKAVYPLHTFGDFCEGAAFVMSVDVVVAMAAAALEMPFLPWDDVFVTGMLAERLGLKHTNMEERYHTGNWGHIRASPRGLYFVVEEQPLSFLDTWLALELQAATRRDKPALSEG